MSDDLSLNTSGAALAHWGMHGDALQLNAKLAPPRKEKEKAAHRRALFPDGAAYRNCLSQEILRPIDQGSDRNLLRPDEFAEMCGQLRSPPDEETANDKNHSA